MRKAISVMLVLLFVTHSVVAQEQTAVNSQYAKRKLLGRHFLSLQWISWDWYGRAYVKNRNGLYYMTGTQSGRDNDDQLTIEGVITEINRYNFKFKGKITTRVSHINNGEDCVREGDMTFAITGKRKYWRLQEIDNPCDEVADYVDIFFRR